MWNERRSWLSDVTTTSKANPNAAELCACLGKLISTWTAFWLFSVFICVTPASWTSQPKAKTLTMHEYKSEFEVVYIFGLFKALVGWLWAHTPYNATNKYALKSQWRQLVQQFSLHFNEHPPRWQWIMAPHHLYLCTGSQSLAWAGLV